jgi:hypothetical protein
MTIPSTPRRAGPYIGNGATTVFSFSFKTLAAAEITVVRQNVDGTRTTLANPADYSVTLNANQNTSPGGSITTTTAPAAGTTVTIASNVPFSQEVDIQNQSGFYPDVVELGLDRLAAQSQQLSEITTRSLRAPVTDSTSVDLTIPPIALRASKALVFGVDGSVGVSTDNFNNSATAAATSAAAALASQNAAATSAANALTSENNAAASAERLIGTSTSSVAVGLGSKSFTTQANKFFNVGTWMQIVFTAAPTTNWMNGQVTAYNSSTGALTVNVTSIAGTGTLANWTIYVSGAQGVISTLLDGDKGDVALSGAGTVWSVKSASGAFALLGDITPATLVANTDNWAPTGLSGASVIRVATDASRNLTGLTGGADGRTMELINVGANPLVLVHDATSTAANRFLCPTSANLTIGANSGVNLIYDATSSRWRVLDNLVSGQINVVYLTSGTSWTILAPSFFVEVFGAGGGGDGYGTGGGGGGGGGYAASLFTGQIVGGAITYAIGAGGAKGNNSDGSAGGTTTFSTLTANGGAGSASRNGGAGGTASGGTLNLTGQQGGRGVSGAGAGGGGAAHFGPASSLAMASGGYPTNATVPSSLATGGHGASGNDNSVAAAGGAGFIRITYVG